MNFSFTIRASLNSLSTIVSPKTSDSILGSPTLKAQLDNFNETLRQYGIESTSFSNLPDFEEHIKAIKSRFEAAKKLSSLYSRMEQINKQLDLAERDTLQQAAGIDEATINEFLQSGFSMNKLIKENRQRTVNMMDGFISMCQTRKQMLDDVDSWLTTIHEQQLKNLYATEYSSNAHQHFVNRSEHTIGTLLQNIKNSCNKLYSLHQTLKNISATMMRNKWRDQQKKEQGSLDMTVVTMLESKIQALEGVIADMKLELQEASKKIAARDRRALLLESMLEDESKLKAKTKIAMEKEIKALREKIKSAHEKNKKIELEFRERMKAIQLSLDRANRTKNIETYEQLTDNKLVDMLKNDLKQKTKELEAQRNEIEELKDRLLEKQHTISDLSNEVEELVQYRRSIEDVLEQTKRDLNRVEQEQKAKDKEIDNLLRELRMCKSRKGIDKSAQSKQN